MLCYIVRHQNEHQNETGQGPEAWGHLLRKAQSFRTTEGYSTFSKASPSPFLGFRFMQLGSQTSSNPRSAVANVAAAEGSGQRALQPLLKKDRFGV